MCRKALGEGAVGISILWIICKARMNDSDTVGYATTNECCWFMLLWMLCIDKTSVAGRLVPLKRQHHVFKCLRFSSTCMYLYFHLQQWRFFFFFLHLLCNIIIVMNWQNKVGMLINIEIKKNNFQVRKKICSNFKYWVWYG